MSTRNYDGFCFNGHELAGDNLSPAGKCRACQRDADKRLRERKKAGLPAASETCRNGHPRTDEDRAAGECTICRRVRNERGREVMCARRKARIEAGEVFFCRKGHRFTLATLGAQGRCRICDAEKMRNLYIPRPKRTTCRNGHPKTPENTNAQGRCLICMRDYQEAYAKAVQADPVLRADRNERLRFSKERIRRARGVPERKWGPQSKRNTPRGGREVNPAPFLALVDAYLREHEDLTTGALAEMAKSSPRLLHRLRNEPGTNVRLDTVSAWLDAMGCPTATLLELYPEDGEKAVTKRTVPVRYEPHRKLRVSRTCDFRGCGGNRGHGPRKAFCPEHGELFDRLKDEFDTGAGRFNPHTEDDYDMEVAA